MDKLLSVVIPAWNEEKTIPAAAEKILRVLDEAGIPCELVFVMRCRRQGVPRVRDGHDAGGQ